MFCPYCGKKIKDGLSYCPECKESLSSIQRPTNFKCDNCDSDIPSDSKFCPKCGEKFDEKNPFDEKNQKEDIKNNDKGFFSFDKMITITLIQILYVIGMFGILAAGIIMCLDENTIILGAGLIFIGNIIWRIICEGIIVVFKIYEKLNQVEKKL